MAQTSNDQLLALLRDVSAKVDNSHKELSAKLEDVRDKLDNRLDSLEKRVDKHEHVLQTGFSAVKWLVPSGGIAALVAWFVSITGGQAK